jgi:hypothetical protein
MDTMPVPPGPAATPDDSMARDCSPPEQRRQDWIAVGVVLMLLLSVFAAIIVLTEMSGASAAVTGGCGGG